MAKEPEEMPSAQLQNELNLVANKHYKSEDNLSLLQKIEKVNKKDYLKSYKYFNKLTQFQEACKIQPNLYMQLI